MNLGFDVQLQVALRALNDVVAPALGDAEKHVVEQLHLAVATISFVKTRLPEARRYYRMELRHYLGLAGESAEIAGGAARLEEIADEGEAVLKNPEADIADFEQITGRLRDEVTALASCADPDIRARLDRLVLEKSGELFPQYRQWVSPFGLEVNPEALPAPAW